MNNEVLHSRAADARPFSPEFLGFLVLCGVLSIFFLLYFNRVFASLVSYGIRTWTWHRYRIWIDIRALQISLLGGRVFFTGLRYHGKNETFYVQNGHITWRYWLRRVRQVDVQCPTHTDPNPEASSSASQSDLPCRIHVALNGLEWFIYNRSPVYDSVLTQLKLEDYEKDARPPRSSDEKGTGDSFGGQQSHVSGSWADVASDASPTRRTVSGPALESDPSTSTNDESTAPLELPHYLQLFPIHVECETAALVMGNENTKAVLIVKSEAISGEIDASATSTIDPYRQIFRVNFHHPVIQIKPNEDFKEDRDCRAKNLSQSDKLESQAKKGLFSRRRRRKALSALRDLIPYWRGSVESFSAESNPDLPTSPIPVPGSGRWQGLSRYLDDDNQGDKARWASVEYAAVFNVVDSPAATMTVYWDVPTFVQPPSDDAAPDIPATQNINHSTPPAWGISLAIKGGTVNYGPWTDRQRVDLQRYFLPTICKDAQPAQPLARGVWRVATQFNLFVELEDEVTMRIPMREDSKNWRWRGKEPPAKHAHQPQKRKQRGREKKTNAGDATQVRPSGALVLKVPANSTITYLMDMLAGPLGYSTTVDVDLPTTELSSSVNHELLWRSGPFRVACDLSSPLKWNELRSWRFRIRSKDLDLFILREHIFLIIDLVDDWASGPPQDYLVFVPFKYYIDLDLQDSKLFLNVNDLNIINNPTALDENSYLIAASPAISANACIPIDRYLPTKNSIPINISVESLAISLHVPPWNTFAAFLPSNNIAEAENLVVTGQYQYNSTTSPANTDTLLLTVSAQSPSAHLFGLVIRFLLKLKDNYFGDDVHFKTLDEYQDLLNLRKLDPKAEHANKPPYKKSNDLDVIIRVSVDDSRALLPANLYSSTQYIQAEIASITADVRFTNYYMDLDLMISPLSLSLGKSGNERGIPALSSTNTQLFIDGVHVYGHRLFGLPPSEPTYLCNWDLSFGDISGECTAGFVSTLAAAAKSFVFSFDDKENALVPFSSIVLYDVTFLRVFVKSLQLWLHIDEAAFLLSSDSIEIAFNDWARSHYSKRANIRIPQLRASCVNSATALRQKNKYQHPVEPEALIRTSIDIAIVGRKANFREERRLQQELVRREDQRSLRTPFLLVPHILDAFVPEPVDPTAQCIPTVPPPVRVSDSEDQTLPAPSITGSRNPPSLHRKSSFISFTSSNTGSILRPSAPSRSRSRSNIRETLDPNFSKSRGGRDPSVSTNHSAFYSAAGEHLPGDLHQGVTFSSQYFAPHFPLESIRPDSSDTAIPTIELADAEDRSSTTVFDLDNIDPNILPDDHLYSSVLVEFPSGITGFLNPNSVRYAAALISALQPSSPEDILDTLQTGCMSEIGDLKEHATLPGGIKDFLVRIPGASLRFFNTPTLDASDSSAREQDQYEISLSDLSIVTRETVLWEDPIEPSINKSRLSLNLSLESAGFSASELRPELNESQAAVRADVERVFLSMGTRDVTYIDSQIGAVRGFTTSGKVDYLASLIHRTNVMASDLGGAISDTINGHRERVKLFIYKLLTETSPAGDPVIFTRPSAVLRSVPGHTRTFDSWKLLLRLRHIWTTLNPSAKQQLISDYLNSRHHAPGDVAQRVISAFERWRSWDLDNIPESVLVTHVFGRSGTTQKPIPDDVPLVAICQLNGLEFTIDPGPKENKIMFSNVSARLERNTVQDKSEIDVGPLSVLNLRCDDGTLKLNWELYKLGEDILQLFIDAQGSGLSKVDSSPAPLTPVSSPQPPKPPQTVHIVLALDRGTLQVDTINLSSKSISHGIRVSLLNCVKEDGISSLNCILECDAVTARLHGRSELLGMLQLREPSVFVCHALQVVDGVSRHTIQSAATSKDLILSVKQDPIVLLELMDILIQDEVAQLLRLQRAIPQPKEPVKPSKKISDRLSALRVNVALFLDQYNISVPLLQSLTYNITGTVARASVAANLGQEIVFDFDIKENSHDMQIAVRSEPRSISLLRIPPTNGRITSTTTATGNSITLFSSVELVQLDASAVYSLLRALNRPQITNAINEVQEQVKLIASHATDILGGARTTVTQTTSAPEPPLAYTAHFTFAGLEIFGKTHLQSAPEPFARLSFALNKIHFEISNRRQSSTQVLEHPTFHANLSRSMFDIGKGYENEIRSCGNLYLRALISATTRLGEDGREERVFSFCSNGLDMNLSPDTISTLVDVLGYLGDKIKDLDTSKELEYLRKLRQSKPKIAINGQEEETEAPDIIDSFLSSVVYEFEIRDVQFCWLVAGASDQPQDGKEDLGLSIELIEFATRRTRSARLAVQNFILQMVPPGQQLDVRSHHSALVPEVIFNVAYFSTPESRRMAFQAVGKSVDFRVTSGFMIPASNLNNSISLSIHNIQQASEHWSTASSPTKPSESSSNPKQSLFGGKRLESLLVDADFAGAVVHVAPKGPSNERQPQSVRHPPVGKYEQFSDDASGSVVLRSPGLRVKTEYRDNGKEDPILKGEVKVEASSNVLYPSVVPLVTEIIASVKEIVSDDPESPDDPEGSVVRPLDTPKTGEDEKILSVDPDAVLGRVRLNLGLRICKQEFSLSCQPIARVAANTCFESIYVTVNTVRSKDHGNFFAVAGIFSQLQASVQHVYSRESTGSFEVDEIELSLMNSKHVSGTSGLSAILKVSPMKAMVNAKQIQDFLLFREIWYPQDLAYQSVPTAPNLASETSQGHLVQRYQQVAATAAFPWTATISIASLDVHMDLGQSLGKMDFAVKDFWVSSKKTSDWEQDLCLGFERISIDSTGRLSGSVALQQFRLRTSIQWPEREQALNETPRIMASLGFHQFRLKGAFDYQAFLVADITTLEFLMYNVRRTREGSGDRLVALFEGEAVQVFGTTSSAAQGVALYQAVQRLMQEKRGNFETSMKEIERFLRRRSSTAGTTGTGPRQPLVPRLPEDDTLAKSPISLDTDVMVKLKALNLGVFPSTFSDHQIFKMEALDAQARFVANIEQRQIHSLLDLTLGQLRIGLAGVRNIEAPLTLSEISVENVVQRATGSRGGTILKVPRVQALMETWQAPKSKRIDYIFKSSFEGKVEVGWNYSRISYIRGMWANHSKMLEQTWGKELPMTTAIRVTGVPEVDEAERKDGRQQKITAEVTVPQSKFDYVPLEEPIIEAPQLRDMGEATPPLEWIGLHRDRLPNLTHQIVIVSLLELAGEVEDAYSKILGSS